MFNLFKTKTVLEIQKEAPTQLVFELTQDVRPLWKELASKKGITRSDMAALCIYRSSFKGEGIEGAKFRLLKSFSPVTNTIKLANGAAPYYAMYDALMYIHCSTFIKWLGIEETKSFMKVVQEILKERYK